MPTHTTCVFKEPNIFQGGPLKEPLTMVVCASSGAGHSLLCEGINDPLVPYWGQLPCWLLVSVGQQGASSTGVVGAG